METRKIIFWGAVLTIIILLAFNIKLISLKGQLSKACTEDYTKFVNSDNCPCQRTRGEVVNITSSMNFSIMP